MNDIDEELSRFLRYLVNGEPADDLTNELNNEVVKVRENKEWRLEYMTLLMRDRENYEKGAINTHIMYFIKGKATLDEIKDYTGLTEKEIEDLVEEIKMSQKPQ